MSHVNYNQLTHIGKTKYKNVYEQKCRKTQKAYYCAKIEINGFKKRKVFDNMRDAALFIDKALISFNKQPVNILKPFKA
tara:strand:- start:104 stop:340 length:237 start_codon:yes stop_codon:yes gene_type:complete